MTRDIRWWHVIALVIIIAGVLLTVWTAQQQDQQLRTELLTKARIAAETVHPAMVEALTGSPSDLVSPDYQHLKVQMARIRAADPSIRFTYLMGQRPDGLFFYVDSEPPDSEDYSPPGQVYTEASPILLRAFSEKGEMTEGPVSDRWGTWVSASVAVTDPETGRLVALFGMDLDAAYWYITIAKSCAAIISASLLILVLVVSFGLTLRHNQKGQRRLAASEEKFSRAFQANPAVMAVSTIEDVRLLDVNSTFLETLGYSHEEVIGKTSSDLGLFSDPVQLNVIISQLNKTGQVHDVDVKIRRKNHDVLDGLFSAITIGVADIPRLLMIVVDITERKRVEDALRKVNQKLNVLSRLTRQDLMNEIFILNGYLDLAKNYAEGQDLVIENMEKCEQTARSINEISNFIQDYQDMGAKLPVWQNVKMALLFGLSHITTGNIQYSLETENLEIFADPLLEMAWQGLFENSIVHGEHVTRIRVWHTITPEGATIVFEDDGIGIPYERKERIFECGDTVRAGVRGLFFVRDILDITNITIRETGTPGTGARFEIALPKGVYRMSESTDPGTRE